MRRLRDVLPWLLAAVFAVAIVNFFWFFIESISIGGDALNGYVRDGHYFVVSHGSATEVSQTTWTWSRIHAISVFVTHPLAIVSGFAFVLTGGAIRLVGLRTGSSARDARARWVIGGDFLATSVAAVDVGALPLGRRPTVIVTSRGIVTRLGWETLTVQANEIRDVTPSPDRGRARLIVTHAGVEARSPLKIAADPEGPLGNAIRALPRLSGVEQPGAASPAEAVPAPPGRRTDRLYLVVGLAGFAFAGVMVALGVFWAIPRLGLFGWVWTAVGLVIAVVNTRRWLGGLSD